MKWKFNQAKQKERKKERAGESEGARKKDIETFTRVNSVKKRTKAYAMHKTMSFRYYQVHI